MYVSEIKYLTSFFIFNYTSNMNTQLKWELLKYQIHKFTIDYTKHKAKERRKQETYLESELKNLENNLRKSKKI